MLDFVSRLQRCPFQIFLEICKVQNLRILGQLVDKQACVLCFEHKRLFLNVLEDFDQKGLNL